MCLRMKCILSPTGIGSEVWNVSGFKVWMRKGGPWLSLLNPHCAVLNTTRVTGHCRCHHLNPSFMGHYPLWLDLQWLSLSLTKQSLPLSCSPVFLVTCDSILLSSPYTPEASPGSTFPHPAARGPLFQTGLNNLKPEWQQEALKTFPTSFLLP